MTKTPRKSPMRTVTNEQLQTLVVAHQTDGARETSITRRPNCTGQSPVTCCHLFSMVLMMAIFDDTFWCCFLEPKNKHQTNKQYQQNMFCDQVQVLLLAAVDLAIYQIMEKKQFSWDAPNNQLKDHPPPGARAWNKIELDEARVHNLHQHGAAFESINVTELFMVFCWWYLDVKDC